MLIKRITTALVLFIITGGAFFYLPNDFFNAFSLLMCLMALGELLAMYKLPLLGRIFVMLLFAIVACSLTFIHYDVSEIIRLFAIIMWCFMAPLILVWRVPYFSPYVISLIAFLMLLPAFYALAVLHELLGDWQLISILAIAWISDTVAYFAGRAFGRRKLAPHISPSKTIEGALAGVGASVLYLVVLKYYGLVGYLANYTSVIKAAIILSTVGVLGDLFESWLKRVARVKDSGTMLPGHGGIFDRIDSLIAIVAIAFAIIMGGL